MKKEFKQYLTDKVVNSEFGQRVSGIYNDTKDWAKNKYEWASNTYNNIKDKAKEKMQDAITSISDTVKGISTSVKDFGSNVFNWFGDKIHSIGNWVKENLIEPIKGKFDMVRDWFNANLVNPIKERYAKTSSKHVGILVKDLERRNKEDFGEEKNDREATKQITINNTTNLLALCREYEQAKGLLPNSNVNVHNSDDIINVEAESDE